MAEGLIVKDGTVLAASSGPLEAVAGDIATEVHDAILEGMTAFEVVVK